MIEFTLADQQLFKRLNTPAKIQDFLNTLPFNFEITGRETIKSPVRVLRERNAHCLEGAILGAYLLSRLGHLPLLLHLQSTKEDFDHVVAPFKIKGWWGALSKTNHSVLRYREPVYKNIRELVMSYFHEYFTDQGFKTLRCYSRPLNLKIFSDDWARAEVDLWGIDEELDQIKHYDLLPKNGEKKLRLADKIEIKAGKLVEW